MLIIRDRWVFDLFLLFLCDIVSPISCLFRSFVSWIVCFCFLILCFLIMCFLFPICFHAFSFIIIFVFFCCGGKKNTWKHKRKKNAQRKRRIRVKHMATRCMVLCICISRNGSAKEIDFGVRADLIQCLCLLGLYKIKKSMVRGHTI